MSAFRKTLGVISILCAAAGLYVVVFSGYGLLPKIYSSVLWWGLFGVSTLSIAIVNWKKAVG